MTAKDFCTLMAEARKIDDDMDRLVAENERLTKLLRHARRLIDSAVANVKIGGLPCVLDMNAAEEFLAALAAQPPAPVQVDIDHYVPGETSVTMEPAAAEAMRVMLREGEDAKAERDALRARVAELEAQLRKQNENA